MHTRINSNGWFSEEKPVLNVGTAESKDAIIYLYKLLSRLLIPNRKPALKQNDEKNCVVVTQIKQCKFKAAVEKVKQFKGIIILSFRLVS